MHIVELLGAIGNLWYLVHVMAAENAECIMTVSIAADSVSR